MVVMSIGLVALLDGLTNYIRISMENEMRHEAMRISEATMETLRNSKYSQVSAGSVTITSPETRRIRNFDVSYTITWTPSVISTTSTAVQVAVTWTFRNITHRHDAASIISTDT